MGKSHVGDIGTELRLDTGVDVAGASSVAVHYVKPDGTSGSWDATAEATEIVMTTISTSWDQAGIWKYQAYVDGLSGWSGRGEKVEHMVYPAIYTS